MVLPIINVPLTDTVNTTIMCHDSLMNIGGFDPFCPKKSYHVTLFKVGAVPQRTVHVPPFSFNHTNNGALCDTWSDLSESDYNMLQSVSCYRICYLLNSQTAFIFWFTLVKHYTAERSRIVYEHTSSAIRTAWYHFTSSERFCGDLMSPTIIKRTAVSMGSTGHFFPTITKSGIPRQILVLVPNINFTYIRSVGAQLTPAGMTNAISAFLA